MCIVSVFANVFLRSMISYPNYKFIFPIKALGMYARRFGDVELDGGVRMNGDAKANGHV